MSKHKTLEFLTIPNDWDSALLGREVDPILTIIRNGLTIPQDKTEGDYKITRIETIGDGFIDENRVRYVSNVNKNSFEKYLIRKGDILFSHINSDPHIGKTAIAAHEYSDLLHGMNLLLLRPNPEVVDPYFLHLVFRFYRQISVFIKICARAVNQSSINQEKLRALEIPLPPLPEQHSIAHVLNTVQTAIEQQARLIALTRELKSALMRKLFTEGLRGEKQKETEIGLVPESWEVTELELASGKPQYGFTESAQEKGSVQFLRITDIQDFGVNWSEVPYCECPEDLIEKYLIKSGDLVFARIGATTGKSFVIKNPPKAVFASYLIRIRPHSEKLDSEFLAFYCQTKQYWQQIDAHKGNNLKGGVNSGILQKLLVPLPEMSEQKEIRDVLNMLDSKITIARKKKTMLEELFRTLLHKLMTSKTRVHEIDLPSLL